MVESYNLKEKFNGNLTKLADHIESAIITPKVKIIFKAIKNDKIYFMLENISGENKCKITFDFTGSARGSCLIREFEDVYAFSVDFQNFYIEPEKSKGYKSAKLYKFRGIY